MKHEDIQKFLETQNITQYVIDGDIVNINQNITLNIDTLPFKIGDVDGSVSINFKNGGSAHCTDNFPSSFVSYCAINKYHHDIYMKLHMTTHKYSRVALLECKGDKLDLKCNIPLPIMVTLSDVYDFDSVDTTEDTSIYFIMCSIKTMKFLNGTINGLSFTKCQNIRNFKGMPSKIKNISFEGGNLNSLKGLILSYPPSLYAFTRVDNIIDFRDDVTFTDKFISEMDLYINFPEYYKDFIMYIRNGKFEKKYYEKLLQPSFTFDVKDKNFINYIIDCYQSEIKELNEAKIVKSKEPKVDYSMFYNAEYTIQPDGEIYVTKGEVSFSPLVTKLPFKIKCFNHVKFNLHSETFSFDGLSIGDKEWIEIIGNGETIISDIPSKINSLSLSEIGNTNLVDIPCETLSLTLKRCSKMESIVGLNITSLLVLNINECPILSIQPLKNKKLKFFDLKDCTKIQNLKGLGQVEHAVAVEGLTNLQTYKGLVITPENGDHLSFEPFNYKIFDTIEFEGDFSNSRLSETQQLVVKYAQSNDLSNPEISKLKDTLYNGELNHQPVLEKIIREIIRLVTEA